MLNHKKREVIGVRSVVQARIEVCRELCDKINGHAEVMRMRSQSSLEILRSLRAKDEKRVS